MNKKLPATPHDPDDPLFSAIADIISQARGQVQHVVNHAMVQAYWQIGRIIVEHELQGQDRAAYGKEQLKQLAEQLGAAYGKGYDYSNLQKMRQFYNAFPSIVDAARLQSGLESEKGNALRSGLGFIEMCDAVRHELVTDHGWDIVQCYPAASRCRRSYPLLSENGMGVESCMATSMRPLMWRDVPSVLPAGAVEALEMMSAAWRAEVEVG